MFCQNFGLVAAIQLTSTDSTTRKGLKKNLQDHRVVGLESSPHVCPGKPQVRRTFLTKFRVVLLLEFLGMRDALVSIQIAELSFLLVLVNYVPLPQHQYEETKWYSCILTGTLQNRWLVEGSFGWKIFTMNQVQSNPA